MDQSKRTRLTVLLASAAMIALGIAFVWLHLATPSDGARLDPGQAVWRPNGVVVALLRPQPASLRPGDVIVAVAGRSMESWAQALLDPTVPRPQWHLGQTVMYTVVRDGAPLDVPVTLAPYPLGAIWQEDGATILFALAFALVALYLVLRRPQEQAPLVLLISASGILSGTTWSFGLQASDLVGGAGFWLYVATTLVTYPLLYIAALHFALIFPTPNGLVADHPRRIWLLYLLPYTFVLAYLAVTRLGAAGVLDWLGRWSQSHGEGILEGVLTALTVAAVAWSYHASRDREAREKIRWVVFGVMLSGIAGLALWGIPGAVFGHPLISAHMLGLVGLPGVLALAIAILRHHLFDIDTLLNRTLVYSGLTGLVVGLYVLTVGVLGALFQAHRGNLLVALVATGVVAVLFQPLRLRLQRFVDRLLFGERDNPYAVLSRLGRRLETALAPEAVLPAIVETVAQALKLPAASIAIKDGERFLLSAEYGVPITTPIAFPLVYHSEIVGQLRVSPRAPDEPFTDGDRRLLEDIAHQAGIAVHATRLTVDLQRSRERLVSAREEERRRLRRDLHDGIGPTLAGLTLKVGAIRNLLTHDPAAADRLLVELGGESEAAISDIRRLVYALRPPALDELGLVGALRAHAGRYEAQGAWKDSVGSAAGLAIAVETPDTLPPLPAAVEVAAYRIACEALANTVRHAQARRCRIQLTLDNALRVEIADDGVGLAPERRVGVGLIAMRERAEELGGSCAITSTPGFGTRVLAVLPLAQE
jgi:two-component system, NarL family, sensor kinase